MQRLLLRGRIAMLSAISGGTLLVLNGCDPNVRDTVLAGVEGATTTLITTFISAFFDSVLETGDEGTVTTVKAIVERLPDYLA